MTHIHKTSNEKRKTTTNLTIRGLPLTTSEHNTKMHVMICTPCHYAEQPTQIDAREERIVYMTSLKTGFRVILSSWVSTPFWKKTEQINRSEERLQRKKHVTWNEKEYKSVKRSYKTIEHKSNTLYAWIKTCLIKFSWTIS